MTKLRTILMKILNIIGVNPTTTYSKVYILISAAYHLILQENFLLQFMANVTFTG